MRDFFDVFEMSWVAGFQRSRFFVAAAIDQNILGDKAFRVGDGNDDDRVPGQFSDFGNIIFSGFEASLVFYPELGRGNKPLDFVCSDAEGRDVFVGFVSCGGERCRTKNDRFTVEFALLEEAIYFLNGFIARKAYDAYQFGIGHVRQVARRDLTGLDQVMRHLLEHALGDR